MHAVDHTEDADMPKGFRSIQTKYILLVLCCVIASALVIGGVCVSNAVYTTQRGAAQNMNLTCETYRYKYDAMFEDVQTAVETSASYAARDLESIGRFSSDAAYRDAYAEQLEKVLALETQNSDSVISYYVRFSPDLLSFERGFRFARSSTDEAFERIPIVKIQDYQESDQEHVGWYFTPISTGTTTWLEPYYNANLDMEMVSCVTPFYKDGELVGVIGMDISFSKLVDDLDDLRIFDNGYAFLCSSEGKIYYHPLYKSGTAIQQDVSGFDAHLENESSGELLYSGVSKGEKVDYAFRTLTNGMRLVLRAPVSEINADMTSMVYTIGLLVLSIVAFFIVMTVFISRRITRPLRELTEAAGLLSQGDYDIQVDTTSRDEVGILAHALKRAAAELKAAAERMKQIAYKDSLTGVRNKTAYNLEINALEAEIENDCADFGIVVFDVNNLKTANDVYGHEQGDKVIRIGCNRICMTFPHSPVFRIGGDEFVAVIKGEELSHVKERLAAFAERTKIENANVEQPQDKVHVAVGVAIFDPARDTCVQDVFNRADSQMYETKQIMKQRNS